jgi:hypothetical protein
MSSFDPTTVRKAVEEFTPRRPQKFQDLLPAKDVILELRHKRGSYRSIADFLTQHCLATSKSAVAGFCHQVLGETVRPRRRPSRKRPAAPIEPTGTSATTPQASDDRPNLEAPTDGKETPKTRTRGPRIAQVRMLTPPEK